MFNEDSNMVGLKVEDKGYINRISRKLFDTLSLYGINIKGYNGSTFLIYLFLTLITPLGKHQ